MNRLRISRPQRMPPVRPPALRAPRRPAPAGRAGFRAVFVLSSMSPRSASECVAGGPRRQARWSSAHGCRRSGAQTDVRCAPSGRTRCRASWWRGCWRPRRRRCPAAITALARLRAGRRAAAEFKAPGFDHADAEQPEYDVYPAKPLGPVPAPAEFRLRRRPLRLDRESPEKTAPPASASWRANTLFFDAPVGLFFCLDRKLGPPQWADLRHVHAGLP